MRVRDALRRSQEDGRILVVTRGGHRQFKHPAKRGRVTVPDLPGCVSTGATLEETKRNIQEAIDLHLEGMREDAVPVPPPIGGVRRRCRRSECA
ncbi:MAG TPA: type II toxin-antitoxin system HicB family antitoxin [Candidatus Dormibacteraeota bacterium]|nr:type II toxin-antitoxin system HicB family antitoxin [Candidatus Dormibacteraeota bacterium]